MKLDYDQFSKLFDLVFDNLVAGAIVVTGLYVYLHGDVTNGTALITFGAGYVFGKSNPTKRISLPKGL